MEYIACHIVHELLIRMCHENKRLLAAITLAKIKTGSLTLSCVYGV